MNGEEKNENKEAAEVIFNANFNILQQSKDNIGMDYFNKGNNDQEYKINEIVKEMENIKIDNQQKNKKILKPRDYQWKIYEKAKNQNSIIYVETGKGKTFISIMLMANLFKAVLPEERSSIF